MKLEKQQSGPLRLLDELCAFLFTTLLFPRIKIPGIGHTTLGGTREVAATFALGSDCADDGYLAVVDVERVDHVHDQFYDDAIGFGDGDSKSDEPIGKMKVLGRRKRKKQFLRSNRGFLAVALRLLAKWLPLMIFIPAILF